MADRALITITSMTVMLSVLGLGPSASAEPSSNARRASAPNQGRTTMSDNHHSEIESAPATPRPRSRARAKISVKSSKATAYDQSVRPALVEINLVETFAGDMTGESTVRAFQVRRDDGSATMVSMQRFSGKLGGREGSFVLQGSETVDKGKIHATWFVVQRSGTGELTGLRGEGGFEGDFGTGSDGTLDYWFE